MCRQVLHPLIRILVRFGVSAGEFKAIVDSVYAHAGSEYLARQGERVTYSRLAVITGINRAFLPAILATPQDEFRPRSNTQLHRAARVLDGWYEDKLFQTGAGDPAILSIDGERNSFRPSSSSFTVVAFITRRCCRSWSVWALSASSVGIGCEPCGVRQSRAGPTSSQC